MPGSTELHLCKDGSHTLFSESFQQYYHNPNGAIAESRHNFFDVPGWLDALEPDRPAHLFETGFGTGLNLLLLLERMNSLGRTAPIVYHAVEASPISVQKACKLNYPTRLSLPNASEILACIFRSATPGLLQKTISPLLTLRLHVGPFLTCPQPESPIDVHLFDPFSPEVNPDLWQPEVFQRLASWSAPDALLATYGAASSARAAMVMGGWSVARAPGALGKREMTLASMDPNRLSNWKRLNESRLRERWLAGEFALSESESL